VNRFPERRAARGELRPHLAHGIAQADGEHGLPGVLQHVDGLLRGSLDVNALPIGKQVTVTAAADRFHQALAEFLLQEADDLAHALQRKAAATKVADDRDLSDIVERIEAPVPLLAGNDQAALVPPLQLARRNAGEFDDLVRSVGLVHGPQSLKHSGLIMFETF
jgi:hypothetical protein